MDLTKYHYFTDEKDRLCSVDLVTGEEIVLNNSKSNVYLVRSTPYDKATAIKICEYVRDGMSIAQIAAIDGMPPASTIYAWSRAIEDFSMQLEFAREDKAHVYFDKIASIADNLTEASEVPVAKARIDAYKYVAEKLNKKSYGKEKEEVSAGNVQIIISTGIPDSPTTVEAVCKTVNDSVD